MKTFIPVFLVILFGCSSVTQSDKNKIDSLFELALEADSMKDYKISIKYYTEILDIDSIKVGALVNRGKALIATSQTQAGFVDLNKAVKYWPHEQTYYARAVAYLYTNQLDLGLADLNKTISLNPEFLDAYFALCNLHIIQENYFSALYTKKLGEKLGMNKKHSEMLSVELRKKLGNDIVEKFNYDKILLTIKNLPKVKAQEDESMLKYKHGLDYAISMDSSLIYVIKVGSPDSSSYIFKMNATTFKVLNPDGKN
jgi:tetratricopeptide (TPR) repeat protein